MQGYAPYGGQGKDIEHYEDIWNILQSDRLLWITAGYQDVRKSAMFWVHFCLQTLPPVIIQYSSAVCTKSRHITFKHHGASLQ